MHLDRDAPHRFRGWRANPQASVPSDSVMLLRLRSNATAPARDAVLGLARDLAYQPRYLDEARTLLELTADPGAARERFADRSRFEDLEAVRAVLESDDAPERSQRAGGGPDTVVRVGDAAFGGGHAALVAGPCSITELDRLVEIANAVRAAGATLLRGGAFKPRSSPYSFQGLGREGLALLAEARRASGLGIVTEVLDPRDVEVVAETADVLQIGSRSMSNAALLTEAGRAGKPVLLKRGFATGREFLLAAEYVLATGNERVVLCERGVRGFDKLTRNLLDVGAIAWLKQATHLPVIADPSHAAGRADLVRPLARAGLAAGADGLIVEVHPAPHELRSDAEQAVSPDEFRRIADEARRVLAIDERTLSLPADAPAVTSSAS